MGSAAGDRDIHHHAIPSIEATHIQGTHLSQSTSLRSNLRLILVYTLIAGFLAAVTSPIPGTSLLLTGLEIFMVVHLAKKNHFDLSLKTIGFAATTLWGLSTVLQDAVVELLKFIPGMGWVAGVIVAVLFVFFLGSLMNLYFSR